MMRRALGIILVVMLALPVAAMAATCPDLVSLNQYAVKIDKWGFKPGSVAVDAKGNTYVTDLMSDFVAVFDRSGNIILQKSMTDPIGIAIGPDGYIYIGLVREGAIGIFDSSLTRLGLLGAGGGEFNNIIDVSADSDRIYGVDLKEHRVKVFDRATSAYLTTIGGFGVSVDGKLAYPTTASPGPGDYLYVMDRRLVQKSTYERMMTARGHIFTKDGTFVKGFVEYGTSGTAGTMAAPGGVLADGAGRVYTADIATGFLQVFDEDGGIVCAIEISPGTTLSPGKMAMGKDGRLLLTVNGAVFVYGVDDYVQMSVSPESLSFEAQQCGGSASQQNVEITNGGPGVLQWTAEADVNWITLTQASGDINGEGTVSVGVGVSASLLSAGTHTGTITIKSQGAEETVSVTATVVDPPTLSVGPDSFSFEVKGTDIPASEGLDILLDGDTAGTVTWSALADSAWISVTPSSGPSNTQSVASVAINADALASMDAGAYTGTITVTAGCDGVSGSPSTVTVSLNYIKGGTIRVTTNADDAGFTITGPETYSGTGTSFMADGVPEGTYTIAFDAIKGFKAPESYSLDVLNGTEVEFVGDYADLRRNNSIIATMGGGLPSTPDDVRVYTETGGFWSTFTVATSTSGGKGSSKEGMVTATGDIDGDGRQDIVVGHSKGAVTAYTSGGEAISGAGFRAFTTESDIELAVGDLNGDGIAEIVVGAGTKSGISSQVRVFGYSGGAIYDTGINFLAFSGNNGVAVATGDVDGDGAAELIAAEGGNGKASVSVRVFDATAGSVWTVAEAVSISAGTSYYGASIAAGDLDADAIDEIIVGTVPSNSSKSTSIAAYSAAGVQVLSFSVASEAGKGADLAAGDTDMDGAAEIVIGEGTQSQTSSTVKVYGADGVLRSEFKAFDDSDIYGVRVSLGVVEE